MSQTSISRIEREQFYLSRMTEHDLVEVVEIEETSGLSRWGWDAYHAELLQGHSELMLVTRYFCCAGEETAEWIAGFIAARLVAGELHINNVAVREKYRQRGLGRALLSAVLTEGARLGARTAVLEVRASNLPAQALYERCGFRTTGRRRNYYVEPKEDALVMSTPL
jgi:[ribosomal protein S18]-alanine N-acetyltransferase